MEWWLAAANPDWSTNFDLHATGDTDGDGHAGWQEYVVGTHPDDSNSVFAVSIQHGPAQPVVWFMARSGDDIGVSRWYRLEQSDGLGSSNWVPVIGLPDIQGSDQKVIYADPAGAAVRFYRVRAWLQE